MKKKEIIDSKHVDHIENEKKILEQLEHPFIVSKGRKTAIGQHMIYATFSNILYLLARLLRIHARQHVHLLRNRVIKGRRLVHLSQGSRQFQRQADTVLRRPGRRDF